MRFQVCSVLTGDRRRSFGPICESFGCHVWVELDNAWASVRGQIYIEQHNNNKCGVVPVTYWKLRGKRFLMWTNEAAFL